MNTPRRITLHSQVRSETSRSLALLVALLGAVILPALSAAPPAPMNPAQTTPAPAKPTAKPDMSKAEALIAPAKDGLPIHFVYWGSEDGQESPVLLYLHGKGGSFRDWSVPFLDQMHRAGFAQILVDLRGHGQTKGTDLTPEQQKDPVIQRLQSGKLRPSDYEDMVNLDLEVIKLFIFDEHQRRNLNMNKLGVIASDESAPLAAAFTLVDWQKPPYEDSPDPQFQTPRGQDVRALVLLSPTLHTGNISTGNLLKTLREPNVGLGMLFAVGTQDRLDEGITDKLYKTANPAEKNKGRMQLLSVNSPLRGAELLNKKLGIEQKLQAFLDLRVKGAGVEWRDRQSRLDKREVRP